MTPARGVVFVRPVEVAESLPGGRVILPQSTRETLTAAQVEVVAVGPPAHCMNEDCERIHTPEHGHRADVAAGDWVILQHRARVDLDGDMWCCTQDDILTVLDNSDV